MKRRICRLLSVFLVAGGLVLCLLPTFWNLFSGHQAAQAITGYHARAEKMEEKDLDALYLQAFSWNAALAGETSGDFLDPIQLMDYEHQLEMLDDGIMGILSIPKLNLQLPIFHGVGEEALSRGAGHLPSSSLPVGSSTGRSVLSAHRGLLQAELFTRLDELREGDRFQIENPKETLVYEVCEIEVILPEEKEALAIRPREDLVTLMTCTPYGINDHRLLVTGRRTASDPVRQDGVEGPGSGTDSVSLREWIFRLWPWTLCFLTLLCVLFCFWRRWKESTLQKTDSRPADSIKKGR